MRVFYRGLGLRTADEQADSGGGYGVTIAGTGAQYIPDTESQGVDPITATRAQLAAIIESLYRKYFNRQSDSGGLNFYVDQLAAGVPLAQIEQAFFDSDEYRAVHLATIDDTVTNVKRAPTVPHRGGNAGTIDPPVLVGGNMNPHEGTRMGAVSTTAVLIGAGLIALLLFSGSSRQ